MSVHRSLHGLATGKQGITGLTPPRFGRPIEVWNEQRIGRGHASFWADAYTVKLKIVLSTKIRKCVLTKKKIEKRLMHLKSIPLPTWCALFSHDTRVPTAIVCRLVCCLRRVETESPFLLPHTQKFCVNATPDGWSIMCLLYSCVYRNILCVLYLVWIRKCRQTNAMYWEKPFSHWSVIPGRVMGPGGYRGNTYLTSLPLVRVRHHGRVTQWKSRKDFTSSASSTIFLVYDSYVAPHACDDVSEISRLRFFQFHGYVFTFNKREYELWKLPLNSPFCVIVTADSKSRWMHGRKAWATVKFWQSLETSSILPEHEKLNLQVNGAILIWPGVTIVPAVTHNLGCGTWGPAIEAMYKSHWTRTIFSMERFSSGIIGSWLWRQTLEPMSGHYSIHLSNPRGGLRIFSSVRAL